MRKSRFTRQQMLAILLQDARRLRQWQGGPGTRFMYAEGFGGFRRLRGGGVRYPQHPDAASHSATHRPAAACWPWRRAIRTAPRGRNWLRCRMTKTTTPVTLKMANAAYL